MTDSHFEVFSISVYGSDHYLVPENKFEINAVRGDLDHLVSAGHAREYQHAVLAKRLHAVEHHTRVAGSFEDEIERTVFLGRVRYGRVLCRKVSRSQFFDQV